MSHQINLDIASDCLLIDFLEIIDQYSAKIVNYNIHLFPNPNFTLEFPSQQQLDLFKTTYPDLCGL
jgi:hypothetical protein